MNEFPLISVLMPCYNSSIYIKDCIDSILQQSYKNFEIIIVDDGSTDDTVSILKDYNDKRIKVFEKEHSGIVDSLNFGFTKCSGTYIARIDSDDYMFSGRLQHQLSYMLRHDYVDILGSGMETMKDSDWAEEKPLSCYMYKESKVTLDMLENGNILSHPTIFMKKSAMEDLPFLYENYYKHAEDYKLWVTALLHGKTIVVEPTIVTRYRIHDEQVSSKHSIEQLNSSKKIVNLIKNINNKNNLLTCIITFKNEGEEVEKTVASILATTKASKILLINDGSDDGYDYKSLARIYFCEYIENEKSLGVASSRDLGVSLTTTKYFVLLDAHMRFYTMNWDEKIVGILNSNEKSIVTTNSVEIRKNGNTYWNEDGRDVRAVGGGNGAFISFLGSQMYLPIFNGCTNEKEGDEPVIVSTVFGAVYASSVEFWNKIGGLHGLVSWGYDETLMSIKTWLSGGKCILLRDVLVGHIYRSISTYKVDNHDVLSNQLYIMYLFDDEKTIGEYEKRMIDEYGQVAFDRVKSIFDKRKYDCIGFRKYFEENVAEHDLEYFKSINNYVMVSNDNVVNNNTICLLGDDEEMSLSKKILDSGYKLYYFTNGGLNDEMKTKFSFELENTFLEVFDMKDTMKETFKTRMIPFYVVNNLGDEGNEKLHELEECEVKPTFILTQERPFDEYKYFTEVYNEYDMPTVYRDYDFKEIEEKMNNTSRVLYKL